MWARLCTLLPVTTTVLAPRLEAPGAIEAEADALAPAVRALGSGAVVVGHSRGGLVATALAEQHPDLVKRLVLVNTPATTASRLTARSGAERILALPVIGHLVWHTMTPEVIARGLASAFAPGYHVPPQFIRDLRDTGRPELLAASRAIDTYLIAAPLLTRLRRLSIPADIIFGAHDQRVSPTPYLELTADPRIHLTTIPHAGHTPIWECPEAVAAVLLETIR